MLPIAPVRFLIVFLLLLSVELIKRSEAACTIKPYYKNESYSYCDLLDDLMNNPQLLNNVKIQLSNNSALQEFPTVTSEDAKEIDTLEIYWAINKIKDSAFKSFSKIKRLSISYNKIDNIEAGTFQHLPVLSILSLMHNGIKVIATGAFYDLPQLKILRLTNNNLTKISNGVFNKLPLQTLALSHNQISVIEKSALTQMSNLKVLSLNDNNITSISIQDFCADCNLERLWLHKNRITKITNYMLEGLGNLKVLNLAYNEISIIEPNSFAQTSSLELLALSNNLIKIMDGGILPLTGLNKLKSLYLDHNRLTFLASGFLFRLNSLRSMTIGGNPWQCPCLDFFLNWVHEKNITLKCDGEFFNGQRPICIAPNDNVCSYVYDDKHVEDFNKIYRNYPTNLSYPFCIL